MAVILPGLPEAHSASSITTFETCEMKYWYEYVLRYRKKEKSLGLKTGITMHDVEEMYLNRSGLQDTIDSIEKMVKSKGWDEDVLFLPKIRAYTMGYYHRWEAEDAVMFANKKFKVRSIEEEFTYDHYRYGEVDKYVGKMDAVLDDGDYLYLWEHKNVSSKDPQDPSSLFWRSLPMNNQLTLYTSNLISKIANDKDDKHYGVNIVYDVIITSPKSLPKIVDRKTKRRETIKEFEVRLTQQYIDEPERFIRKTVPVLFKDNARRMEEIGTLVERMKILKEPIRNTTACKNYGGCEFFDCCIGADRVDESSKFEKADRAHVELSQKQTF